MKKIYTLALSLAVSCASFARIAPSDETKKSSTSAVKKSPITKLTTNVVSASRAGAIWSDDFSTPSNWASNDNLTQGQEWTIGSTGPVNASTMVMTSTSGADWAIFDSDQYGDGTSNDVDLTLTTPVDLTGHGSVQLTFEQYYMHYADVTTVYISGDNGASWTPYVVNSGYPTDVEGPNPELITVDISATAGNQTQVLVRFNFTGAWDYFWQIDDIAISDIPATNLTVLASQLLQSSGSNCNLSNDNLAIIVKNTGSSAITVATAGDSLELTVNGISVREAAVTSYNLSYAEVTTIDVGDTVFYVLLSPIDMSAEGDYVIDSKIIFAGSGDGNNLDDNGQTINISHTTVYDLSGGAYTMGFESSESALLNSWTVIDANNDGVDWAVATTLTNTGAACFRKAGSGMADDDWAITGCIDLSAGETYQLSYFFKEYDIASACELATYLITDINDLSSATVLNAVTIPADDAYYPVNEIITPGISGTYYIGFHATSGAGSASIRIDDVNLDIVTSVNKSVNKSISLYPNPSTGLVTINATTKTSVEVISVVGTSVYKSEVVAGKSQLNLSNLANGNYIVKLNDGTTNTTERLVINK